MYFFCSFSVMSEEPGRVLCEKKTLTKNVEGSEKWIILCQAEQFLSDISGFNGCKIIIQIEIFSAFKGLHFTLMSILYNLYSLKVRIFRGAFFEEINCFGRVLFSSLFCGKQHPRDLSSFLPCRGKKKEGKDLAPWGWSDRYGFVAALCQVSKIFLLY